MARGANRCRRSVLARTAPPAQVLIEPHGRLPLDIAFLRVGPGQTAAAESRAAADGPIHGRHRSMPYETRARLPKASWPTWCCSTQTLSKTFATLAASAQ
jgi:hypothetical protein